MSERDFFNKPSAPFLGIIKNLEGKPGKPGFSEGELLSQQNEHQTKALEAIEKVVSGLTPTEMRVICENPQNNTQVLERVQGQLQDVLTAYMVHSAAADYERMQSDESWRAEQRDMEYVRQRQRQAIATYIGRRLENVDDTLGFMRGDLADISCQTGQIREDVEKIGTGLMSIDDGVRRVGDEVEHVGRGVAALQRGQEIQTDYLKEVYRTMSVYGEENHEMLDNLARLVVEQTGQMSREFALTREQTRMALRQASSEVVAALGQIEFVLYRKLDAIRDSADNVAYELHAANVGRMRRAVNERIREAHIYNQGNTADARACETAIDALTLDPSCFQRVIDASWDEQKVRGGILKPLSIRNEDNPDLQMVCLLQAHKLGDRELAAAAAERLFSCVRAGRVPGFAICQNLKQFLPEVFPLIRGLIESSAWSAQPEVLFFLCRMLMEADYEVEYARRVCLTKAFKADPEIRYYQEARRMDLIVSHLRLKLGREVLRLKRYAEFSRRLRNLL